MRKAGSLVGELRVGAGPCSTGTYVVEQRVVRVGSKWLRRQPICHQRQKRLGTRCLGANSVTKVELLVGRQRGGEIHTCQRSAAREPSGTKIPAVDVRRFVELLPHSEQRVENVRVADREAVPAHFLYCADNELDRPGISGVSR